jgi:uncharacterized membrane protein
MNSSEVKMKKINTKKIALLSVMLALVIIFCFVPISFGTVTLALMILPVLVVAQIEDFWTTLILSILMGCVNEIAWYTTKAAAPLAPVFQNPLVCILPRILIGVFAWCVTNGLRKLLIKDKMSANSKLAIDQIISAISGAVGVVVNTGFVGLFTVLLFNGQVMSNGTAISLKYILAWFGINFVIEVIAFALLTPPISLALQKAGFSYKKVDKKAVLEDTESNKEIFEEGV